MFAANRQKIAVGAALLVLIGAPVGCAYLQPREEVPYTGRKRPPLRYTEQDMNVLGAQAYKDISGKYPVVTRGSGAAGLKRVGVRLAETVGEDYEWEFKLFEADDVINAFCLPGGKIGVFTGMLRIAPTDDLMAVVLSHEIAHAVLQHSNERLSQPLAKKLVGIPTTIVVETWGAISPRTRKVVMSGLGAGYLFGELLPYSQKHEIEADEVGLIFMQRAGYDLDAAPRLWLRMEEESKGRITDSVSSHPGSKERAEDLERRIQEMESSR